MKRAMRTMRTMTINLVLLCRVSGSRRDEYSRVLHAYSSATSARHPPKLGSRSIASSKAQEPSSSWWPWPFPACLRLAACSSS